MIQMNHFYVVCMVFIVFEAWKPQFPFIVSAIGWTIPFNKLEFSLQSHDNVISVLDGHLILCASPIPIKSYLIKLNVKDPSSPLNVCQGLIGEDRHDICFEEMKWLAVSLLLREILFPSIGAEDKSAVSMDTSFQKLFRVITAINVYANVVLKFCHP